MIMEGKLLCGRRYQMWQADEEMMVKSKLLQDNWYKTCEKHEDLMMERKVLDNEGYEQFRVDFKSRRRASCCTTTGVKSGRGTKI